ncbi:hypothetical protein C7S16_4889 [Burkholderia thailandensis]|uniref:Uncharacterized protein n=1 Tax=Burkholderia thailandensis TaxID=57975 RepID=A0AAW9CPN1_BURTH|nr:hypothetical protein [Burkholderia thailandensis]MDW9252569.1 hypothetical protein [Burkholderia thailandensis]
MARAPARLHPGPAAGRRAVVSPAPARAARIAVRRSVAVNVRRERGIARRAHAKGRPAVVSGCGATRANPVQPRVPDIARTAYFP